MEFVKGLVAAGRMLVKMPVTAGADCKANPTASTGHVKITMAPERLMVSCGALTGSSKRLNTVPPPELPPFGVVP